MQGRVRLPLLAATCLALGAWQAPSLALGTAGPAQPGDTAAQPPDSTAPGRSPAPGKPQAPARPLAKITNSPREGFTIARVLPGHSLLVRRSPAGRALKRVGSRTEFGTRRFLSVAKVRGDWIGLEVTSGRNGRLGWIERTSEGVAFERTIYSLRADVGRRILELRDGRRVVRRIRVAVGRPGSTTPAGRFAITDKLSGRANGAYYGCCILALSGHQPQLPPGWRGGSRLAIHGTNDPGSIGRAASAGCLRARDRDLRALMTRVPLGAPVFIRR